MISFRTVSGRRIDLQRPRGEDVEIGDIARGLSHCCRFAGQLQAFYSVAQHSILVAELCDERLRFAALLHDATEAYMGDLSRHLKHSEFLNGYRVLEQQLAAVIQRRFRYLTSREDLEQLKRADDLAACFEHVWLRERSPWNGREDLSRLTREGFVVRDLQDLLPLLPCLPRALEGWAPAVAEAIFLERFGAYRQTT